MFQFQNTETGHNWSWCAAPAVPIFGACWTRQQVLHRSQWRTYHLPLPTRLPFSPTPQLPTSPLPYYAPRHPPTTVSKLICRVIFYKISLISIIMVELLVTGLSARHSRNRVLLSFWCFDNNFPWLLYIQYYRILCWVKPAIVTIVVILFVTSG